MTTTLQISEAVPLLAAWCDRFARHHGHRSLLIKGHVLEEQGLRGHHNSVDVDLLLDPATFDDFIATLAVAGWTQPVKSTVPGAESRHAVTVFHDLWPITIDVHRYFPGFLADPQTVFDALWERHTTAAIAHVLVKAPDPVGHAALAALHYLRSPKSGLAMTNVPELVDRTPTALGEQGLAELSDLSVRVGAAESLASFLEQIGAPKPGRSAVDDKVIRQWEMKQTAAPSTNWLLGIFGQPVRRWPGAIWHAIWLTDHEIDAVYRQPGQSMLGARWRRLRKGFRNLPGALSTVVRYKVRETKSREERP